MCIYNIIYIYIEREIFRYIDMKVYGCMGTQSFFTSVG